MKKLPIIIDCDPGIDDTLAIILAIARQELEVKAITAVAGNQTLDKTLLNAKKIVSFLGKNIPVAAGAAKPLVRELITAPSFHGENGLGGVEIPAHLFSEVPVPAVELMYKTILESPEPVTLVPIGPLTNIALLFSAYPEVKKKISQISLMGGGLETGNQTAVAEFNIYVDPEAADIVFKSGLPIIMAGLDVTHKALIRPDEVEKLRSMNGKVSTLVTDLIGYFSKTYIKYGHTGPALHDPCSIAWLVKPELFSAKPYHISIETSGTHTLGMTVGDRRPWKTAEPNALVLVDIDREAFVEMLLDACRTLNSN